MECGGHAAAFSMAHVYRTEKAAAWPPHSKLMAVTPTSHFLQP